MLKVVYLADRVRLEGKGRSRIQSTAVSKTKSPNDITKI